MILVLTSWLFVLACDSCQDPPDPIKDKETTEVLIFKDQLECKECHSIQFEEWEGSAMHAASSPTFSAFELVMNRISDGAFAHGSGTESENFCSGCHIPNAVLGNEFPEFENVENLAPSITEANPSSLNGVNCHFCHSIESIEAEHSLNLDGVGTAKVLQHDPDGPMQGRFETQFSPHESEKNLLYESSEFCGSCHDVRAAKTDVITGDPFLRVEETFTEWKESDWATGGGNSPLEEPVTCQGCHMSNYPDSLPNERPIMPISTLPGSPDREHANHNFTAVSIPLFDNPNIPMTDSIDLNGDGQLATQAQRREKMLGAACTLVFGEESSTKLTSLSDEVIILLDITNVGAGHNVPSGFSQEREVWIELTLVDDSEQIIYQSGHLEDSPHQSTGEYEMDGLLHDEDLQHRVFNINPDTFEGSITAGPDANQRPNGINLGLAHFNNDFEYIDPVTGVSQIVMTPFQANHINNDNAIAPFETRTIQYDIPIDIEEITGNIYVEARLLYRSFPPKFLRLLAHHAPNLIKEEHIDRNTIVEMETTNIIIRNTHN